MLDKLHNSGPGHEADLISYMYGEMDVAGRDRFESHLATCDSCAVELGAFADARLGVIEWRRNDFDHLATPAIIIPEPQPERTLVAERPRSIWAGWLETIFSLPRMTQAGMGLAAAALLMGVLYFALPTGKPGNGGNSIVEKKVTSPIEQRKPENMSSPTLPDQAVVQKKSEFGTAQIDVKDRRPTGSKLVDRPQRITLHQTPVMRNYRRLGPLEAVVVTPKVQTAPTLNTFEEEEDTTLRLSDLFSQVGPRKK